MRRIERMEDKPIEEAQSRLQNMDGGSIEQMGRIIDMIEDLSEAGKSRLEAEHCDSAIDAMGNGRRYGYDGQGGNAGGRQGYREPYIMDDDGDGEGRMGHRNRYGNFPADPKSRRRMRRSGCSEGSIDDIRQMTEGADPGRKRQPKRDLEGLMPEMRHGAVRFERRCMGAGPGRSRWPAANRQGRHFQAGDDWPVGNVRIPAE